MESQSKLKYAGYAIFIAIIAFKIMKTFFRDRLESNAIFKSILGAFFVIVSLYIIVNIKTSAPQFILSGKFKFLSKVLDESGVRNFYYILAMLLLGLGLILIYLSLSDYGII